MWTRRRWVSGGWVFQCHGAVSGLRPVAMAALTTALGIIPLLFDAFFVAMAVTSFSGRDRDGTHDGGRSGAVRGGLPGAETPRTEPVVAHRWDR